MINWVVAIHTAQDSIRHCFKLIWYKGFTSCPKILCKKTSIMTKIHVSEKNNR